jgi:hypothetical protein
MLHLLLHLHLLLLQLLLQLLLLLQRMLLLLLLQLMSPLSLLLRLLLLLQLLLLPLKACMQRSLLQPPKHPHLKLLLQSTVPHSLHLLFLKSFCPSCVSYYKNIQI